MTKTEVLPVIKCCLCGLDIQPVADWVHGNNAEPVAAGRCCYECDALIVLPARIAEIQSRQAKGKH